MEPYASAREVSKSEDKSYQPPEQFFAAITPSLQKEILSHMGGYRKTKLVKFANRLYGIASAISFFQGRLAFERDAEVSLRASRLSYGRARKHVQHSLTSFRRAEDAVRTRMAELRPGLLNFSAAEKSLQRLEKTLGKLEFSAAAMIHPGLRTADEKGLAAKTPYKMIHPDYPVTAGSAKLQYEAVELLEPEIQEFTGGRVQQHHVDKFIADFLKASLGLTVAVSNVKTIRQRIRDKNAQIHVGSGATQFRA